MSDWILDKECVTVQADVSICLECDEEIEGPVYGVFLDFGSQVVAVGFRLCRDCAKDNADDIRDMLPERREESEA